MDGAKDGKGAGSPVQIRHSMMTVLRGPGAFSQGPPQLPRSATLRPRDHYGHLDRARGWPASDPKRSSSLSRPPSRAGGAGSWWGLSTRKWLPLMLPSSLAPRAARQAQAPACASAADRGFRSLGGAAGTGRSSACRVRAAAEFGDYLLKRIPQGVQTPVGGPEPGVPEQTG